MTTRCYLCRTTSSSTILGQAPSKTACWLLGLLRDIIERYAAFDGPAESTTLTNCISSTSPRYTTSRYEGRVCYRSAAQSQGSDHERPALAIRPCLVSFPIPSVSLIAPPRKEVFALHRSYHALLPQTTPPNHPSTNPTHLPAFPILGFLLPWVGSTIHLPRSFPIQFGLFPSVSFHSTCLLSSRERVCAARSSTSCYLDCPLLRLFSFLFSWFV